jgi:hypothetical protein
MVYGFLAFFPPGGVPSMVNLDLVDAQIDAILPTQTERRIYSTPWMELWNMEATEKGQLSPPPAHVDRRGNSAVS